MPVCLRLHSWRQLRQRWFLSPPRRRAQYQKRLGLPCRRTRHGLQRLGIVQKRLLPWGGRLKLNNVWTYCHKSIYQPHCFLGMEQAGGVPLNGNSEVLLGPFDQRCQRGRWRSHPYYAGARLSTQRGTGRLAQMKLTIGYSSRARAIG
jgi:hypothetical protein